MASRIAGITIEIGGDTSNLQKSLKGVDSQLRQTQNALKDVNKLLKLDPGNTDLLRQKQQLLRDAVTQTAERLDKLKAAQAQMDAAGVDKNSAQYQALQREIIETEAALKQAKKAADSFHPALEKVKASAKKAADGLKTAADKTRAFSGAAAGALAALGGLGYKALTTADDILTMAQQTGFSTDELQRFAYASDRVDVSMNDITKALTKLKTKVDPSNESLKKLGVSVLDADGGLRDATEVFYDTLEALSLVGDETLRDQLAMELFGKSADSLAGIIDDGGAALKAYGDEAESVGAIMDEKTLKSLGSMNDELDKLKAQGMATLIQAGAKALQALSPVLEKVASAISKVLEWISQLSPETLQIIVAVLGVIAVISPLLSLLSALATAIAFLASPIGLVVAAIGAAIAVGVALYANWETIKNAANDLANRIKTSWTNIKTSISSNIQKAKTDAVNGFNTLKNNIVNGASNIVSRVRSAFSGVVSAITTPFNNARTAVQNAVNTIKNLFPIKLGNIFSGIKLPHFNISGGTAPWGIGGQGTKPSISISWYRKAMNQPYLLDGATIFGAMGNKLLGGGEAGREVILSYDKLKQMGGTTNINIVVNASRGMNEAQLADMVARRIQQQVNRKGAVWA